MVTKSIGLLIGSAPQESSDRRKLIGKAWHGFATEGYWNISTAGDADQPGWKPWRSDREIARDWLYGELVHADPNAQRRLRYVPMDQRLNAGTLWAKDGVLLTRATVQFITDLRDAGELPR